MTDGANDGPALLSIGHAIVRSDPWRFESADAETRQMFDLPDGDVGGIPLFLPADAVPLHDSIDVTLGITPQCGVNMRAKLLPLEQAPGLYSAVFFHAVANCEGAMAKTVTQQDLQHRISNCLAVVRSIFRRTAQASGDMETLVSHFLGRLVAFSRIQSNIALYDTYGVALDELILDEFMAHATRTGDRLSVEGPPVRLRTRPAETLSLAIHELATNSVKFGALGAETGMISVKWRNIFNDEGQPVLCLMWDESGVALHDEQPRHRGFGNDMIRNSMAFDLGAKSVVRFDPDGFHMEVRIPISDQLLHR